MTLQRILKTKNIKNCAMKKITLLLFTFISINTSLSYGQEFEMEEKTITGVYEMKSKTKSELFSSINKWISINYNSAKNVIQMNDKEAGTIIIKGINEVKYKNLFKTIYPKNKYILDYTTTKFNHLIEINVKDSRYRVVYRITDIAGEENLLFNCIGFDGNNDKAISEYSQIWDDNLKKGMIGKKKRGKFKLIIKPMFDELNNGLIDEIKLTMKSIEQSIKSKEKDEW
jgi:hypothetical protein